MRVPDLDWRSDLFDDAIAVADSPIISQTAQSDDTDMLWPALRRAWTAGQATMTGGRPHPALRTPHSILQISAARNAINAQRS